MTSKNEVIQQVKQEVAEAEYDILFQPSPYQQQLKSQFWTRFEPGPMVDRKSITLGVVQEYVSDPRLRQLWGIPGFKEWFTNSDELRERLEYLVHRGFTVTAEEILSDPKANANAKVQLLKLLADMTNKLPKAGNRSDGQFSDDTINKMGEKELRDFLKRKGVVVQATYKVQPGDGTDEGAFGQKKS